MANDERPLPKGWRPKVDALKDRLAEHARLHPELRIRVEPKHPAYRNTRAEIRQLEDELQLRRCAACDEGVIEGENEGSQMAPVCSACLRRASEPGAA